MTDFRTLTESFLASPQISLADVEEAKATGVAMIVNNRPDGEDPDAPQGYEIESAAVAAGLEYRAIPVGHSGFTDAQVDETIAALNDAGGPVLAYCRSGTRSTLLWALAQAKLGENPDDITRKAMAAGYDVSMIRSMLEKLAAG